MKAAPTEAAPALEAALDDLRRIREVVDRGRETHPIRLVGRALMDLFTLFGLLLLAFGVAAQLLVDLGGERVVGLAPRTWVWIGGALCMASMSAVKLVVFARASRAVGFDLNRVMKTVFTVDYARIMVPILLLGVTAGIAVGLGGQLHMLAGLGIFTIGAAMVAVPVLLPLPGYTWFGIIFMLLGGLFMVVLPEWPFYKLAAGLGLPMLLGGLIARRVYPEGGAR